MKSLIAAVLATICLTGSIVAQDSTESDRKWASAVEQMISSGPATISTPSQQRVEIAKGLAEKFGRKSQVVRTDAGFRIVVE